MTAGAEAVAARAAEEASPPNPAGRLCPGLTADAGPIQPACPFALSCSQDSACGPSRTRQALLLTLAVGRAESGLGAALELAGWWGGPEANLSVDSVAGSPAEHGVRRRVSQSCSWVPSWGKFAVEPPSHQPSPCLLCRCHCLQAAWVRAVIAVLQRRVTVKLFLLKGPPSGQNPD